MQTTEEKGDHDSVAPVVVDGFDVCTNKRGSEAKATYLTYGGERGYL
jgi:hypothetical protein